MQAIVEMYCDRKIQLAISSMDDVSRLTRFYGRFGFAHAFGDPPQDKIMMRQQGSDLDDEDISETADWCSLLRDEAANRSDSETRGGIDLSRFNQ